MLASFVPTPAARAAAVHGTALAVGHSGRAMGVVPCQPGGASPGPTPKYLPRGPYPHRTGVYRDPAYLLPARVGPMLLVLGLVLARMLLRHDSMCRLTHAVVCSADARATPPAPSAQHPDVVVSRTRAPRLRCRRRTARAAPRSDCQWQHSRGTPVPPTPRGDRIRPATTQRRRDRSDAQHTASVLVFADVATTPTPTAPDVAVKLCASETPSCPCCTNTLGAYVSSQLFWCKTARLTPVAPRTWLQWRCAKSAATVKRVQMESRARLAQACKSCNGWCTRAPCPEGLQRWWTTWSTPPQLPWRPCAMGRHSGDPHLDDVETAEAAHRRRQKVARATRATRADSAARLEEEEEARVAKDMATQAGPAEAKVAAAKKSWHVQLLLPRWRRSAAESGQPYYQILVDEFVSYKTLLEDVAFAYHYFSPPFEPAQFFSTRQLLLPPLPLLHQHGQNSACVVCGEGREETDKTQQGVHPTTAATNTLRPPLREPRPRYTRRNRPTLSPPMRERNPRPTHPNLVHFKTHPKQTQRPRHFVHKSPPAHPYLGRRIGEASNPGPTNQAQRQRTLHALTQMGIVPQREDTFHSPREDAIGESTPPMVGPNWQAQGPPEEPDLPPPQAARSWLYVPLLLHAAGELHATAVSAWAQHPSFAAVWPQWVAHLRRAVALPHSRLRAATFIQAAAMNTSPVWPHQAFRDLAPQDLCDITGAVCRCRDPSGYIPAPFQEVLLQLYGGEALCLELDRHLHQASTQARGRAHVPEDPVPAEDLEPMECPDTQLASVAGAHNAGGRRRRRRAQRPTPRPVVRHAPQLPAVSLYTELRRRVLTLQAPPAPLRGALKTALRDGLERIRRDPASSEGWALFLLAPRMLLYRQQGENKIALEELHRRVAALAAGHHQQLLDEAAAAATCNSRHTSRKKARDEVQIRAERAAALAQLGELSAASSALTAPPLAPANAATVAALRDPDRRPPTCQVPLPEAIAAPPLHLNQAKLVANLRSARRGAAAGPSGTTTEHLRVLLDDEESAQLLYDAAQCLASGDIPQDILRGLRLGRMVALQKPDGGVRGLVMSDVFRRLVGRTLAQQFSGPFNTFCAPFQYALSARAGTEALARAVRIASEANGRTTVLSIDGVGAYDHISRSCMLQGLQSDPSLATLSPYVRQFYGEPSTYLFYDEAGAAHKIQQGEGGEQGDPLMPALYAVGQHRALLQVHSELQAGENLFAYLDDIYLTCPPERAGALFASITAALRDAANVQVHLGKTRAWNEAGEEPSSLLAILPAASRSVAWTGSWALPTHEQGVTVLGTPLGHRDFVAAALGRKQDDQALLFQRIPAVPHLQSAWLLLLLCALPRCNYLLRALPPATTATYAAAHDKEVLRCLTQLLGVSWGDNVALPRGQAQLPLHFGGLGLRAATASCAAAHWASWADSLPVIGSRHPHLLASILPALQGGASVWPSVTAANLATAALTHHGFRPPSWLALAEGARPPLISEQRIFGDFARGWQRAAMAPVDREALEMLFSEITPASRALLLSQAGPGGSTVLTTLPTRPEYYMGDDVFRVTLLRRLRWPLPPTARVCRCGGELDILGDHRAACATAGVLVRRAVPVERVVAQICREAGGRVATDVFLRELNLGLPITDARRLEVVANGLPSFHGAQVAVDVTLVCPIQRDGCPRPGADTEPGLALAQAEERKSRTYPEFGQQGRCKLVVLALEVGGRWSTATQTFLRALARGRALASPSHSRAALAHALQRRWGQMLTVAANTAFSSSLLELPATAVPSADARWT